MLALSKLGKTLNDVTESAVKIGGVVTKHSGHAIGDIGKVLGASDEKCQKIEDVADSISEDIYNASTSAGNKVEEVTNEIESETKKMYHKVKNKINNGGSTK